ncbi:uncharacterized mitochondrial protein AtMg00820-like [Primulina eburnea]|uniref:uncharacterized mitochondrial protein AtMg00820-like n=1 Tax=Primulina eburnea TaxID=1245227 RepID=UPI003C6CA2B3
MKLIRWRRIWWNKKMQRLNQQSSIHLYHVSGGKKYHPLELVIGNPTAPLRTRKQMIDEFMHAAFVSQLEPKKIDDSLNDINQIDAMQEELNQFERSKVWHLVLQPVNLHVIGTKWVFRNKMDENGSIVRNKARLVAQSYRQEEYIDFDESFAPVARL